VASGFQAMGKIPELRRRLLYTLALLAVYRIGVFVTTPGVNASVMKKIVSQASGSFLGLFNMFSGGALEQMSIFALGIMPYISASIIMQLLTVVIPKLEQVQKEGEIGRRRINQYTRYGCVILRNYLDRENGHLYRALGRYNGSHGKPEYPTLVVRAWQRDWHYAVRTADARADVRG
jgi:preprotein translocase subunit SecY